MARKGKVSAPLYTPSRPRELYNGPMSEATARAEYEREINRYGGGLPEDAKQRLAALRDKRIKAARAYERKSRKPSRSGKTAHVPAGHANGGQFTGESNPPSGPVKPKRQRKAKDTRPKAPAGYSIYHQLEDARAVEDFAEVKRLQGIIKRRKNVANNKPAPPARKRKPASSEAREVANLKRRASRRNMNPADELAILEGMEAKKTPKPRQRKASAPKEPKRARAKAKKGGYEEWAAERDRLRTSFKGGGHPDDTGVMARIIGHQAEHPGYAARYTREHPELYGYQEPAKPAPRPRKRKASAPTRMNRVADGYPKHGKRTRRTKAQAEVVYMDARGGHLAYRRRHPR